MAEYKKFKLKKTDILLIAIAAAFTLFFAVPLIAEIIKSEKARKEIRESVRQSYENDESDVSVTYSTPSNMMSVTTSFSLEDKRKNVLTEVPEDLAGRGIILRGSTYRKSGQSYRGTTHGDSRWYFDYVTSCNLNIDGSDNEFKAFLKRFGDEVRFPAADSGYPEYYNGTVVFEHAPREDHFIVIYRTKYVRWDCSGGKYQTPGTYGVERPIFYDPSGRYIFDMTYSLPHCEDLLIKFLEPVMTRVELTRPGETKPEFATETVKPEVIEQFIDAMHELEANEYKGDTSRIKDSDEVFKISFTTETGRVHDYYFVNGEFLIYKDKIYHLRNCQKLQSLVDEKTLFYIDAF